jgi:hypothetical protein
MSLLNILTNRSKVNAAAKKTARARKREGEAAEQLFQEAFRGFQEVVGSDSVIADALYHWGFALFHQAQTRTGEEADRIYRDAGLKFAFCMTMNPQHLGAAIDWGAALMEQARVGDGEAREQLYALAREKFLAANAIQAGTASYNLACIHAIRGEDEDCRTALEDAREHGSLPGMGAMLNDADLASVQHRQWFNDFMESLQEQAAAVVEETALQQEPQADVKQQDVAEGQSAARADQAGAAAALPEADEEQGFAEPAQEQTVATENKAAAMMKPQEPAKKPGFMDFSQEKPAATATGPVQDSVLQDASKTGE